MATADGAVNAPGSSETGFGLDAAGKIKIVLVGDSTVTDNEGWGAGFKRLVDPENAAVVNEAQGGRSSKSFIDEGHWRRALGNAPDYMLIQFGHNDQPGKGPDRETDPQTTYKQYLSRYVDEARAAGIQPILVTSISRREWGDDGKIHSTLTPYANAVLELAKAKGVPVIDMQALTIAYYDQLGPKGFELFEPKTSTGLDHTHLNAAGSDAIAAILVGALKKTVPVLAPAFK